MSEMKTRTPEEELRRAGEARQVLESSIFLEACQHVEDGLHAQRLAVPLRETEMHTALIATEQLWQNLKDYLQQVKETGKFAEKQLQQQRTMAERMRDTVQNWRRA